MSQETSMQDFIIIKQIGEGSFGKVYKVKKKSDQKIYAIKIINISKLDYSGKQSAMNEIRILCSINNEFIVAYKEVFTQKNGGELCIVMEYVGGGDLLGKIDNCRKNRLHLEEKTIWKYFCQIILGLKKLHRNKIIHRDIKSANLFLSKDFEKIKLGDLNVAKIAKNDFAKTQIGTPYYLAPEIWKNAIYDYRCDIFSLGVVIYEMTSLKLPFQGTSIQDLQKNICKGFFHRIPSKYSEKLYQIIKLMLTINPRQRPNIEELIKNPIVREKMSEFGYLDLEDNQNNIETLINTIIVPRNLNQLQKKLPKEKKYVVQSCMDLDEVPQQQPSVSKLPNLRNPPLQPKFNFNKKQNQEIDVVKNYQQQKNDNKKDRNMRYQQYLQHIQGMRQRPSSYNKNYVNNQYRRNYYQINFQYQACKFFLKNNFSLKLNKHQQILFLLIYCYLFLKNFDKLLFVD